MKRLLVILLTAIGLHTPALADLRDGALAYRKGDFPGAIKQLKPLADEGHAMAQYLLASALLSAAPPVYDLAEGERWLKAAAGQGSLAAIRDLGNVNRFLKKPPNFSEAKSWYRLAADKGDPEAQHMLGVLLLAGEGLERKPSQGYMWLQLSAERGHILSSVMLREMKDKFSQQEVEEGTRLAKEWKPVR